MKEDLESFFVDAVTERPQAVVIGKSTLHLYPVTLAKTLLLKRHLDALGPDLRRMAEDPYAECLRLAGQETDTVAGILAIHTAPNTREALHDQDGRRRRQDLLADVKREHLAGLLVTVLTSDKTEALMDHFGMTKERERLREAMRVKEKQGKNSLTFGGRTLLGNFIGPLKEMGYRDEEILYERGYSYLRLMLADKLTSVYMTDEEQESLPQEYGGTLLDGNDPGALDELEARIKNGSR